MAGPSPESVDLIVTLGEDDSTEILVTFDNEPLDITAVPSVTVPPLTVPDDCIVLFPTLILPNPDDILPLFRVPTVVNDEFVTPLPRVLALRTVWLLIVYALPATTLIPFELTCANSLVLCLNTVIPFLASSSMLPLESWVLIIISPVLLTINESVPPWYKFNGCPTPIVSLPCELSAVVSFWSALVSIVITPPEVILEVPISMLPNPGVIEPLSNSPTLLNVPNAASASDLV